MLPSAHFASGVVLFTIAHVLGVNPLLALPIVIGAVLPDFDYLIGRMHRTKITHAPAFWFLSLTPLAILFPYFLFLEIGVFAHLILDTIDWGVMWLHPHKSNLYGGVMRRKNISNNWTRHYLSHNGMISLELTFLIAALAASYFFLPL